MERPADDIFLLNDLGPMQSPVSRHLFLGHSSATPTSSSFGSNNNTVKTAVKTVSPKPKPTVNNENVFGNSASPLVPMKRKRGRPPKNKSLVVEEQDVLPTAPSPPVVPPASTIVTNSNSTVSSNTPTNNINSPKIITLTDWSLATVPNSAKLTGVPVEVRSLWVVLVGRRADMVEAWHSSIVTERILGNHIKTGSGRSLYILESPMNIIEMQANGFSESFIAAFKSGFPENWRSLLMAELERLGKGLKTPQAPAGGSKPDPTPTKRGPGRPRKTPTKTDHQDSPTIEELFERKKPTKPSNIVSEEKERVKQESSLDEQIQDIVNDSLDLDRPQQQPDITVVKRGRGRPRKYPLDPSAPAPTIKKTVKAKKQELPSSSPPAPLSATVTSSRRRSGNASTIKWGWGGKAVIQTDDKR